MAQERRKQTASGKLIQFSATKRSPSWVTAPSIFIRLRTPETDSLGVALCSSTRPSPHVRRGRVLDTYEAEFRIATYVVRSDHWFEYDTHRRVSVESKSSVIETENSY